MEMISKVPRLVHPSSAQNERGTRRVGKRELFNRINYLHFQGNPLHLVLEHTRLQHTLTLHAAVQFDAGERIACRWTDSTLPPQNLADYSLQRALIPGGREMTVFLPAHPSLSERGASFFLPEEGIEVGIRQEKRHPSPGLDVQLSQNGLVLHGQLRDFAPTSLRVALAAEAATDPPSFDPEMAIHLVITGPKVPLFSGDCRLLRESVAVEGKELVLQPANSKLRRFRPREHRSRRQQLLPAPGVTFCHPLSGRTCQLPVVDLSGSGVAVEETLENAVLLPGLIIPELEITFAGTSRMRCRAQVLYRREPPPGEKDGKVRCGLAILDMALHDQAVLLGLLLQAEEDGASLGGRVDPDELWQFFFESGFIYPEKYRSLQDKREHFRETCRRLYAQELDIARHFLYREGGRIHGHIAMLRFYDRAWLIHHHAADRRGGKKAGLKVLEQISRYVNELHHLPSARLGYVFCYFRPENRFPNRLFGGVARHIDAPARCAVYPFAYQAPQRKSSASWELPAPWQLRPAAEQDLQEMHLFLSRSDSGQLLAGAFDLEPGRVPSDEAVRAFEKTGFRRTKQLFTLKRGDSLVAAALVDIADLGLNLSELTSSIKVFILDQEALPRDILESAIAQLRIMFDEAEPSVLVHPQSYAEQQGFEHEKTYNLWLLDLRSLDGYFQYCRRFFRN